MNESDRVLRSIRSEHNDKNTELVNSTIEKYRKKNYAPVENISIDIKTKENIYKLIRLNDEQFYLLRKNCILIHEDYSHLMHLSRDDDVIFQSFSKMYATLKEIFGESGKGYDDWKGSFSFPFLIHFKKEEQEFSYLINIHNIRSSIEFKLAKLICADDGSFERGVFYHPFQDFPREEIKYFTNYLVGFLTGYFESAKGQFDEYFFKTVESNLVIFGCKDGCYFDNNYETEKEFREALQELKNMIKIN